MTDQQFDVVIIGAGFAGLRMLHEARALGLSVRVLEAGSEVGGTWHWNRYPGARTDCEAWVYCYAFDKSLQDDWDWPERYPSQGQVQAYLKHVAERFDMYRDLQMDTWVSSAQFDGAADQWTVTTGSGERLVARVLVTAVGPLSAAQDPQFPGLKDFQGEWYQTAKWPHQPVDFRGKRVAVIGTGASGIQTIPLIASVADHLTVFQRTANYALPARNFSLDDLQRQGIKANYEAIWEQANAQPMGLPLKFAGRTIDDVTPEEAQRILEVGWETGGFGFFLETFDDVFVNPRSNAVVSEFVRNKIRTNVKDPATAELLCPNEDHPIGAKRPPLSTHYYETFNRDNVELVDVNSTAITEITAKGIRLADGTEYEVDVIVFALGFDALTGALTRIDIRGRTDRSLAEKWQAEGPRTHLSIAVDEFPNMFMISGPQIPFANAPSIIEGGVQVIGTALETMRKRGSSRVEVSPEAVEEYNALLNMFYNATIFPAGEKLRAWWVGTNVEGKPMGVAMNFGGFPNYVASLKAEADSGFPNYQFGPASETRDDVFAGQSAHA